MPVHKKIKKFVKKAIPKEIAPFVPAVAGMFLGPAVSGILGNLGAGLAAKGGIGSLVGKALTNKMVAGGLGRALVDVGTQALTSDRISPASALLSGGLGALGGYESGSLLKGANPNLTSSLSTKLRTGLDKALTQGAKLGRVGNLEGDFDLIAAGKMANVGGTLKAADDELAAQKERAKQLAMESEAFRIGDNAERRQSIIASMLAAGFDRTEAEAAAAEEGYAMGGRVGFERGGGLTGLRPRHQGGTYDMVDAYRRKVLREMGGGEIAGNARLQEAMRQAQRKAELAEYKMLGSPALGMGAGRKMKRIYEPLLQAGYSPADLVDAETAAQIPTRVFQGNVEQFGRRRDEGEMNAAIARLHPGLARPSPDITFGGMKQRGFRKKIPVENKQADLSEYMKLAGFEEGGQVGMPERGGGANEEAMAEMMMNMESDEFYIDEEGNLRRIPRRRPRMNTRPGMNEDAIADQMFMMQMNERMGRKEGGTVPGLPAGRQVDAREGMFIPMGGAKRTDDVPAMLSVNEFVLNDDAVAGLGKLMTGNPDPRAGARALYKIQDQLEAMV